MKYRIVGSLQRMIHLLCKYYPSDDNDNKQCSATVLLQAFGGLLIGAVLKYASNVAKGFATSISMIASSVLSIYIFDFKPTTHFVLGSIIVAISVALYSQPTKPVTAN